MKKCVKGISGICSEQDKKWYCRQQYLLWCSTSIRNLIWFNFFCVQSWYLMPVQSDILSRVKIKCKIAQLFVFHSFKDFDRLWKLQYCSFHNRSKSLKLWKTKSWAILHFIFTRESISDCTGIKYHDCTQKKLNHIRFLILVEHHSKYCCRQYHFLSCSLHMPLIPFTHFFIMMLRWAGSFV